ncbi:peptide deformylase [Polymorphobacter fuscus]|uniref:Peptide deformylase n=1 Tax=Sandarakinorhabdus fusca TaxID=1439888 RepID=A0A7C9KJV1_9SPHN|nr:peptide deformylase [Polymorphobacter fuscus]KAB7643879.1 peptide deformylase [Polymorphobacter fuscus]MQT18580.1 peptide deformylase [Polymorphobacter fuscus]NJC07053.1 peptide deformylase [Polymorphobacter fuscus]
MAILDIIETPDPRLRVISKPVETVTDTHRALIADMFETMYDAPGIGLAAVQVGVAERILVIDLQRPKDPDAPEPTSDAEAKKIEYVRDPKVFINPVIVWESDEMTIYNEGCLSVPELYGDVDRPARVRATWLDETGQAHEQEIDGLLATCLQHEMDHLDGILFIDHLSKLKRDMLLKKLEKLRRAKAA